MIMGNDVKSSLKQKKQFAPIKNTWNRDADFLTELPTTTMPHLRLPRKQTVIMWQITEMMVLGRDGLKIIKFMDF